MRQEHSLVVSVKVDANGDYKATNAGPNILIQGERRGEHKVRVTVNYICVDDHKSSFDHRFEVQTTDPLTIIGARTTEYFEFDTIISDRDYSIQIAQDTAFHPDTGIKRAALLYEVKVLVEEQDFSPLPKQGYGYFPASRPIHYVEPDSKSLAVVVGDAYAGFEERPWKVHEFRPADYSDPTEVYLRSKDIPGNTGLTVYCKPLKANTSYSLILQPGDDGGEEFYRKFWVTTRSEI